MNTKIVEIKVMLLVDKDHNSTGKKAPIMFLSCGHGHKLDRVREEQVGDSIFCAKCAEENRVKKYS